MRYPARRHDTATVSIHVRDLSQIFNSLDPSPFWDRDLDKQAAEFIESEFSDRLRAERWQLHVRAHEGAATVEDIQAALQRYYERMVASTRSSLREQARVAEVALLAGAAVFSICISLQSTLHDLPRAVDEGLIVLAWIALWRPIEMLAYGWLPLQRRRRLYERLMRVRVSVRLEPAAPFGARRRPLEPVSAHTAEHIPSVSGRGEACS